MEKPEFKVGIFFDMPNDTYHAIPALSASGIKNLLISEVDFWVGSWMNPNKPPREDKACFTDGNAYHAQILEGDKVFNDRFTCEFDESKYPDALNKTDDLKAWLRDAKDKGHTVKLSGTKSILSEQILNIDPTIEIMDVLKSDYGRAHSGKQFITRDTANEIEIASALINADAELSRCFTGGYPEVSIFWIDKRTGVPMKSRVDYLKIKAIIDLKTFQLLSRINIDRAIPNDIAKNRYDIQAAFYYDAVENARELAAQGLVFGDVSKDWIDRFSKASEPQFVFVYVRKVITIIRGKVMPKNMVVAAAKAEIENAIDKFVECSKMYGEDRWFSRKPIEELDDSEFPIWLGT